MIIPFHLTFQFHRLVHQHRLIDTKKDTTNISTRFMKNTSVFILLNVHGKCLIVYIGGYTLLHADDDLFRLSRECLWRRRNEESGWSKTQLSDGAPPGHYLAFVVVLKKDIGSLFRTLVIFFFLFVFFVLFVLVYGVVVVTPFHGQWNAMRLVRVSLSSLFVLFLMSKYGKI